MKTAESIEEQGERKQARDNKSARDSTPPVKPKLAQRDATRIAPWRWPAGKSANPGGRPRNDIAKEIAVAIFANNTEALYKAYRKALLKGNAYALKELADRAFGKL